MYDFRYYQAYAACKVWIWWVVLFFQNKELSKKYFAVTGPLVSPALVVVDDVS